jgi:nucleoid-associated protein YgaU
VLLACLFAASPAFAQTISPGDLAALTARAESGDPESLNNLGNLYANGRGVPRNMNELRVENARLNDTLQALERDRTARLASLQQENAALSARLRQAQGTLDQIASAARLMNPGATSAASTPTSRPAVDASQTPRYHTVVEGDSLSRISLRYYGTANRWQEIYEANRDVLSRENVLRPGQRLQLP